MPGAELYAERRRRFYDTVKEGVALFFAAPEARFGHDVTYRYRPDPDLFYLTGFAEPETLAVLDASHRRCTLFVRKRDRARETWEGRRAGPLGAVKELGADRAYPLEKLDEKLPELVRGASVLHHALGQNEEADRKVAALLARFRREARDPKRGPTAILDPTDVVHEMRLYKSAAELETLGRSCEVAARAHREAMKAGRAGRFEYELQAVIERRFLTEGAPVPAYPTIVASGANATILHYVENRRRLEDGELVLVDAGCELGGYASDITRTFPVSGRFTPLQRRFYRVVLEAQEAAIAAVAPGATIELVHETARARLIAGLLELGLMTGRPSTIARTKRDARFVLHRTSHWLGLDVHDRGRYTESDGSSRKLKPGMVITVEPGLYVRPDEKGVPDRFRGLGVRIEDDVLVTGEGAKVLTSRAPKEPDEVEAACAA